MPRIYLCFLWHMHQPFYKDLLSGEYKLPWTRLHALKDYYGMVKILEEFPKIRQTFNLVPSMMVQIEEYASGEAHDPYLALALKPAESLTDTDKDFLLHHFFHAHPGRMIYRYPRYGELYEAREARKSGARSPLNAQDFRDLQVLSQLAWFDEYFQEGDPVVRDLLRKGRDYSLEDQARVGEKEREIIAAVIPAYKKLAASGQIEISTTPFYHPILPLLCDSDIAGVAHPHVPLPRRFSYPQDARTQLEMAREYITRVFGAPPVGLWPSEGSVSDEVFRIASEVGFGWAATDNGVLDRTLGRAPGVDGTYRPYLWQQDAKHKIHVVFRDHLLSDLIGFVYSGMGAREAAADFLQRIRANCAGILASGRDALVPVILDGENAWEYYHHNARPFFRELYGAISNDAQMESIPVREAFERVKSDRLDHIFPGSWINANFDIWIGSEEDNKAWEFLRGARQAYDAAKNVSEEGRKLAWEELLIAEGSDWCWWYGPEHDSANRPEFDELFRSHIANVYRALNLTPPEDLSRPILTIAVKESKTQPSGPISPVVDGAVSSYFEWLGAGVYHVDQRSGSMHGKRFLVREIYFGLDERNFYLRVDFRSDASDLLNGLECRFCFRPNGVGEKTVQVRLELGRAKVAEAPFPVDCAFKSILELAAPLKEVQLSESTPFRFNASFWHEGLPVDALPQQGWLEVRPDEWEQ